MSKARTLLWRIGVTVPMKYLEDFEAAVEPFAATLSWFLADPEADENEEEVLWRLEGYSRSPVDRPALTAALAFAAGLIGCPTPKADVVPVVDADWVAANMLSFQPIMAQRFFVHGSHFEGRVPAGRVPLQIDAGTAFGSGEHATTFGCLTAIDRLLKRRRFSHPLDLGCGSGILAIALAKAGRGARVTAADIDPVAVRVAARNARINGVGARVSAFVSTGYASRHIRARAPYDLVTANILARPLKSMAAQCKRHLAPGGVAVLSGLLVRHEPMVASAHRLAGLSLLWRHRVNGWSTLVLGRRK